MQPYLEVSKIIDWQNPTILELARSIASPHQNLLAIAKACFEWVRDEIRHSYDDSLNPVTCAASDVLKHKTGFCYAKSHLLAALLRANQIPAGFCYQRLWADETGTKFCLHGFNAIYLNEFGWYRVDARGNRADLHTHFSPPHEQLAYRADQPGEVDFPEIFAQPLAIVVNALQMHQTLEAILQNLPDRSPANC
ncbi:transglutaminase family protein [Microcoleus sp. FACHB-1515]|uniref:transglutaminase-like domain-containing protein n=1 Tax=Cyanophyceae TaxID=3028117 RepID=UPI0016846007|nr:transglutaminase family protein [Microcoleus sp. FACHB-1515]MBD2091088.1 transglutaminase family protein [Microcoleus sp. FACHB-1515]